METATLKLWELLGQKPRKSYLTPNVAEMVLIDVMSKYHGWIAGPSQVAPGCIVAPQPC